MNLFSRKDVFLIIISSSLIFSEFYFFNWNSRALISNKFLIVNVIIIFIFSLFIISSFFFILIKYSNKYISENSVKNIIIIYFSFIYYKLIQVPFFLANLTSLKGLFIIFFKSILFNEIYFLIPLLKIIFPFMLIFLIFYLLFKKENEIIIKFLFVFSSVFFLLIVLNLLNRAENTTVNNIKSFESNSKRQVIWFILDEYDPRYIKENQYGVKLKNIESVIETSVIHQRSFAPASYTLVSVPSTLMQIQPSGSLIENHNLKIFDKNKKKFSFNYNNTIFKKLNDQKLSFKITSEVLTYCAMLNINKNCNDAYNKPYYYLHGLKNTFFPYGYLSILISNIKNKKYNDIKNLNTFNYKDRKKEIYLSKKLDLNLDHFEEMIDSNVNLIFIHLAVPHTEVLKSNFINDFFEMNPVNDDEKYIVNLKYTDFLIKNILEIFNQNEKDEILLLLTSNHWRRHDSPKKALPALFVSKIKNDNSKFEFFKDNVNIFIPDLIMGYLKEDIKSHKDVMNFLNQNPIFDKTKTYIKK